MHLFYGAAEIRTSNQRVGEKRFDFSFISIYKSFISIDNFYNNNKNENSETHI